MRYKEVLSVTALYQDAAGRPHFDEPLRDLCRAFRDANMEALGHVDASRVLFICAAARRGARASIRPLTLGGHPPRYRDGDWEKPQIWIDQRPALYEIALRPRYFLDARPEDRARIICHELWHISPRFDGTLACDRRHRPDPNPSTENPDEVADRWIAAWRYAGARGEDVLTFCGELRLSAWTDRPPSRLSSTGRRRYTQDDLHSAIVEQR